MHRGIRYVATGIVATALLIPAPTPESADAAPRDRFDAVNVPSNEKVLFLMGQDSGTLSDFKADVLDVDETYPRPDGVTLYTNLVGSPLAGIYQPVDFGTGRTYFPETLAEYDGALAVGLYLKDCSLTPLKAIAGDPDVPPDVIQQYQAWTDELIEWLRDTNRDVYLRIGYEFDGEWNCYQPAEYKAAFRHIAERIDALGAGRVATVWQSAAWPVQVPGPYDPTAAGHWNLWYPGDDAVDWVGISTFYGESYDAYQLACLPDAQLAAAPRVVQDSVLDFARARNKPVMIAEAAPQAYDLGESTAGCIFASGEPWDSRVPVSVDTIWSTWFAEFFAYIQDNRDVIRAVSYINTDWDSQQHWQCTAQRCPNGYWGDSRLQANPEILARVRTVLRERMWAPARRRPGPTVDMRPRSGVLEAEYEPVPAGWSDAAGYGGFALPEPSPTRNRHVMLANYQRWEPPLVQFPRVGRASTVTVRYAAVDTVDDRGPLRYTLLVDGEPVGSRELVDTGGPPAYVEDVWNVVVPNKATVTVLLDGNIMWVDRIEITR
ncbi:endo-1,3-beta-xylanase [Jiangella asiatica]|uniref:Endo-1,3-beta-xylanase n=1 Tax=Jiangella asiatica TaxID=2530372 RepID=A0A4R5DGU1_9ACTN|nr:endo-1,3-beta-xylanase [Jiangella asiatica]TDE11140.1 endo-1,3-beta-xylanase [Jiangella asiatica]